MLRNASWNAGEEMKIGRYTLRLKRSVGEGGFAFIHLVEDVQTGRVLVLKRSSLQSHEGRVVYEKEASIMRSLAHPNIVQIVTAVELSASRTGAIVMEYCPRGHLLDALNRRGGKRMQEEVVLSIMSDVVSAVKYLHDKGITHRDVKLENILRSSSGPHKLCDFGSCVQGRVPLDTAEQRANEEEVVEKTTTQMYRAPEMVDLYMASELTERVDVWALGCVLFAICYLKNPFQDAGNLGILNARIRIPEDSDFSDGLKELIRRALTASPVHRPSAAEFESGIHAISKGQPLPPPRHPKPPETQRSAAPPKTAGAIAAGTADTASGRGSNRDGGRSGGAVKGLDTSGRSGQMVGVKGKASTAQKQPTLGGSPAKLKEAQLNPNSVAARRLASRKGSSGLLDAGGPGSSAAQPSSAMEPSQGLFSSSGAMIAPAPTDQIQQQQRRIPTPPRPQDGAHLHSKMGQAGATVAAPGAVTQIPEPAWSLLSDSGAAGTAIPSPPDGWSNFAAFDQFPASEHFDMATPQHAQGHEGGSVGECFNAPGGLGAVGDSSPLNRNVAGVVPQHGQSAIGGIGGVNGGDTRHVRGSVAGRGVTINASPRFDLASHQGERTRPGDGCNGGGVPQHPAAWPTGGAGHDIRGNHRAGVASPAEAPSFATPFIGHNAAGPMPVAVGGHPGFRFDAASATPTPPPREGEVRGRGGESVAIHVSPGSPTSRGATSSRAAMNGVVGDGNSVGGGGAVQNGGALPWTIAGVSSRHQSTSGPQVSTPIAGAVSGGGDQVSMIDRRMGGMSMEGGLAATATLTSRGKTAGVLAVETGARPMSVGALPSGGGLMNRALQHQQQQQQQQQGLQQNGVERGVSFSPTKQQHDPRQQRQPQQQQQHLQWSASSPRHVARNHAGNADWMAIGAPRSNITAHDANTPPWSATSAPPMALRATAEVTGYGRYRQGGADRAASPPEMDMPPLRASASEPGVGNRMANGTWDTAENKNTSPVTMGGQGAPTPMLSEARPQQQQQQQQQPLRLFGDAPRLPSQTPPPPQFRGSGREAW